MNGRVPSKAERRPNALQSSEKLRKSLRRINLIIPIDAIGLILCIGSLIVEGYNTLLCALTGLLGIQLLFFIILRRDTREQLQRAEDFEEQHSI